MKLRQWQHKCITRALEHFKVQSSHFLCLATPGAGKTIMAAQLAKKMYYAHKVDFILCFSPSLTVAQNMQSTFERLLRKRFDGKIGAIGCSYTYQSMINFQQEFWQLLESHNVLVVFDEIHHCGGSSIENANRWGQEILVNIRERAAYTLALTGTPWRSDQSPIVLSQYQDKNSKIQCNYIYGLKEAVKDSVCRTPTLVMIDNERIQLTDDSNVTEEFGSIKHLLAETDVSYEDIISSHDTLRYVLKRACYKLSELRQFNPQAGGLIVASSIKHAHLIRKLLEVELKQSTVMVSYQQENSNEIINSFRESATQWIVSIGMVSEGTDIPRLQVCCHLSRIRTELYFRQVLGRVLRTNDFKNQEAWLFTFCEPTLKGFAKRVQEEIPDTPVIFDRVKRESKSSIASSCSIAERNLREVLLLNNNEIEKSSSSVKYQTLNGEALAQSRLNEQSLAILGCFREQVIETFNSPF